MTTLIAFLVAIAILIVVHELGHYGVARLAGVKVLRFSVGFGPVIARRVDRHGTEWVISALPLGGYVKMVDEREGDVAAADLPHAFNRQSVGRRAAIVAAGPLANFMLAIVLYWALFVHGLPGVKPILAEPPAGTPAALAGFTPGERVTAVNGEAVEDWQGMHWRILRHGVGADRLRLDSVDAVGHLHFRELDLSGVRLVDAERDPLAAMGLLRLGPEFDPVIGEVVAGGAAARAGLRAGDRFLALDDHPTRTWREAVEHIRARPDVAIDIRFERDGEERTARVVPDRVRAGTEEIGRIGAAPRIDEARFAPFRTEIRLGGLEAIQRAVAKTWELSIFSLDMLGRMLFGEVSLKNLSGPVPIADYAGRSAQAGWIAFVGFLALISVSLGVLNLLPIPLLDGGHLLYYLAEVLTGRPVSESVQIIGQKIGAALLAGLMFLALYNDLQRLLGG